MKSNPYGANQYVFDPRKKLLWESYINPESETFANAKASALKAGYEENYADNITGVNWFKEKIAKLNRLQKAEKVLDEVLDMNTTTLKKQGEEEVAVIDPALVKIKQDTAKFLAERLGKDTYSTRSEVTGKDGESITVNVINYNDTA